MDFALYCPEGLQQFPTAVLSPLFHVSYWESSDVAAFVVRQVLNWFGAFASPCGRCGLVAWLRLISGDTLRPGLDTDLFISQT